jgi:hypothetical protein
LREIVFKNHEFEIFEEADNDLYIKIERECRTQPFLGMKQPTPRGAMLGYEVVLTVKHFGEPAVGSIWEIRTADVVLSGEIDKDGKSRNIDLPMPYSGLKTYSLKLFAKDEG